MGRGRNCILPPMILRRMVREPTKSLRITVKEMQGLVASWGLQVSKSRSDTTSITTTSLEGLPEESLFWPQDTEETTLSLPNVIYIMTRTRYFGQMRPKLNVFVRYSIGMFGVGTEMHTRRSTSYPRWNMVVGQSCFNSRNPAALVWTDGIINSKNPAILAENLVPSARRLGLSNKTMTQEPQDHRQQNQRSAMAISVTRP